jgi:hypothetical protein
MSKANITRFTNLDIDPSLDPGNPYKLFRCPHVSTEDINKIPADGLKGGELIYNSSDNLLKLYGASEFNTLPYFRRGKVNLGDVGNNGRDLGVLPASSFNGFITGAELISRVDNLRDVFSISYEDNGYIPYPVASITNISPNADTKPITSINIFDLSASSLKFIIGEVTAATADIVIVDWLLLAFPGLPDPDNPDA